MHKALLPIISITCLIVLALWSGTKPVVITAADGDYPYPGDSEVATNTPVSIAITPTVQSINTAIPTATADTDVASDDTDITAEAPAITSEDDTPLSTETPTATIISTNGKSVIACTTGDVRTFSGNTTPNTLLSLYFAGRVVGGGISDAAGHYDIIISMGSEAQGIHPIVVTKRQTGQIIARHYCVVVNE